MAASQIYALMPAQCVSMRRSTQEGDSISISKGHTEIAWRQADLACLRSTTSFTAA